MIVTKDLSSRRKLRKVYKKKLSKKSDFRFKNMEKNESPKMTSKVVYGVLIRSDERFMFVTNLKFDDCQKHERKPAKI